MKKYNLDPKDIKFESFRRGKGPGGQNKNKTATSIRATHLPTGIKVESSNQRSLEKNKETAIEILQDKLNKLIEDKLNKIKQDGYDAKNDAAFSSQIRTYRMVGNSQGVLDHRTGISHPDIKAVLNGDIERFLMK
jgi:peptide chain release factor 2